MEDGLPSETTIQLHRNAGHIYDLVNRREITPASGKSGLTIPLQLGPCEGRMLMVTDRPIREVSVKLPESAARGEEVDIQVSVTDGETPLQAVVPLHVSIIDPEGIEAEFTGYYGAADGKVSIRCHFATNDRTGLWQIRATELASGLSGTGYLRLNGP
jgi:hypothetical protein